MTVRELIELLEDEDQDAEVRMQTQENWPFENQLLGVTNAEELVGFSDEDEDEEENVVYLVEGRQLRYGNRMAWEAARR